MWQGLVPAVTDCLIACACCFLDAKTAALDDVDVEKALKAVAKSVKVASGVVAQWDRPGSEAASATEEGLDSDSEPVDLTALGKDGKISWLCSVPAQTKTNLTLNNRFTISWKSRILSLLFLLVKLNELPSMLYP